MNRILLVDDEEGIRINFKRLHDTAEPVFRGRLEMDVAEDLKHAEEKLSHTTYDAIILDLKFKGVGTDDTVNWILAMSAILPPIIVFTGDADIFVRGRCMMAGAASFWLKLDAAERPDLFFKEIYNQYLKCYASRIKSSEL